MDVNGFGPEFGKSLDSSIIESGLRRLNPDLHFDLAAATNQWHPRISHRQGVYHAGRHICSMDRGMVPEFKVWTVEYWPEEVDWAHADEDDVRVIFEVIDPKRDDYKDLFSIAEHGKDPRWVVTDDGKLQRRRCIKRKARRGRCVRVGWRHTFEKLIHSDIPGVTRDAVGKVFNVDMYRFPVGEPDEIVDSLMDE